MYFSPVIASKNIYDKYKRYLNTIFSIADNDYNNLLKEELSKDNIFSTGPFIDINDVFEKGASVSDLINKGLFPKSFIKLNYPLERKLYKHQEDAISRLINSNSIVVSTGTGSGKTESFLLPILRDLVYEYENNKLTSEVRALIIYPMNALANDQISRLRDLLKNFPAITFGSYTGQTPEESDEKGISNELKDRKSMRKTPPQILITNYSMLEYLMLRPADNIFFTSDALRYIVLDEAHVYGGSKGIEVSMLLRRLKAKLKSKNLQFILTSATLGDEKSNKDIIDFASSLTCDTVYCDQDIIRAKRVNPLNFIKPKYNLTKEFYKKVSDMIDDNIDESNIVQTLSNEYANIIQSDYNRLSELLYDLILYDEFYYNLRKNCPEPMNIKNLAKELNVEKEDIVYFTKVATKAEKNLDQLFDARYHMFIRATDSIFITLPPKKKLFLNRLKEYTEGGLSYKVFEIATCIDCHQIYILGKEKDGYLEQFTYSNDDEFTDVYLLNDNYYDDNEDYSINDERLEVSLKFLCPYCGMIDNNESLIDCDHNSNDIIKLYHIKIKNEDKVLRKCLVCENSSNYGILRRFYSGHEAVTSVIGTALYEELPSHKIVSSDNKQSSGLFVLKSKRINKESIPKQFISFSDNRQAAAFFASYFDQTYQNILYRRLILEVLKKDKYQNFVQFDNFLRDVIAQMDENDITASNSDTDAWKAILKEIVEINQPNSLYSMGLFGIDLNLDIELEDDYQNSINSNTIKKIINILIQSMLIDGAITNREALLKSDLEDVIYKGIEWSYSSTISDREKYIKSFIPVNGRSNRRLDYISKLQLFDEYSDKGELLTAIWELLINEEILLKTKNGYRIDIRKVNIFKPSIAYKCNKCQSVTLYNVENVCPKFKCNGKLEVLDESYYKNNHYYNLYHNLEIRKLIVKEHTAQLDHCKAKQYQDDFTSKSINVLSCSTTFEMGIDLGTLETVLMRNMPPSPANYAQRAGRAGRSKNAAAYALTFSNRSSHDFAFFKNPKLMIKGKIKPPKFNINNEKIAIRHVFASAFSYFWLRYNGYFGKIIKMLSPIEDSINDMDGLRDLKKYLESRPKELNDYLKSFLPKDLIETLEIDDFKWIDKLIGDNGVLTLAAEDYFEEYTIINKAKEEAQLGGSFSDVYLRRLNTIRGEDVISFLSKKNVLPKYGFPVDTVELKMQSNEQMLNLELTRDLSMALSEYAPESQVVADGNLITSRYIRKIPKYDWLRYDYIKCNECMTLNVRPSTNQGEVTICKACGKLLESLPKTFIVPMFGFQAESSVAKPGLIKPKRTYRSEIFYVGYNTPIEKYTYEINNHYIEISTSKNDELAVLNESNFYVCETCGYTEIDNKQYKPIATYEHQNHIGWKCLGKSKKYSLGYTFKTDVLKIDFIDYKIYDRGYALSLLYGILKGMTTYLDLEENEISGCLAYFSGSYSLIFFDRTPGGAGHVSRANTEENIKGIFKETLKIMESCTCGDIKSNTSCYSCLRNYYNQKYHDYLNRGQVIDFFKNYYKV